MSEPWQPPDYTPVQIRQGYTDYECGRCGVFFGSIPKHTQYHFNLDLLRQALLALTLIMAPDMPEGQFLIPATGVTITAKGGDGGSGSAGVVDGSSVGRGGGGNDVRIPECPICFARGGGGHGGGCRNAGRPISEWTTA